MKRTTIVVLSAFALVSLQVPCVRAQMIQDSQAKIVRSSSSDVQLNGVVKRGYVKYKGRAKPTEYLYLHLEKPIDVFGDLQIGDFFHACDVQLAPENQRVRKELASNIDKEIHVIGRLPMPPGSGAYRPPFGLTMRVDRVDSAAR